MSDSIETGKVKFFNKEKGFGFIIPEGAQKDIFFHHSQLSEEHKKRIKTDDDVSFNLGETDRGECANNVCVL